MNKIKEIDILDKSKFTLNNLFGGELTILDKELSLNDDSTMDGILFFNDITFSFTIVESPTIGQINKIIHTKFSSLKNNIFVFGYASDEIITFCKENNIFFVDTAGNCFINLPTLKVSVEGKKNILNKLPETRVAFQKTGLKLIFQLLIQPNLAHQSFREISKITNISLASISKIFEELKEDGFIIQIGFRRRRLSNIKRLITKWAINYSEVLKPKIHRGYFRFINIELSFKKIYHSSNGENKVYFGGEHGAYFFNRVIKANQQTILYTNSRLSNLVTNYKIIPTSKSKIDKNKVEVFEIFWNNNMNDNSTPEKWTSNQLHVPPILIYADLINSNNYRSVKAAEDLLENEIRTRFITDNFQW